MKKALIGLMALALVAAVPAMAGAHPGKRHDVKNAARYCKSLRDQLGVDTFRQTYGGKHAFGKCVSQRVHELRAARRDARQACKAELGAAKLRHEGSVNRGAFSKCVRAKFRATTSDDDDDVVNAAKECDTERDADEAAFTEKYGTNHNKRNAFGKCVSSKTDDEDENENEGDDDNGSKPDEPGGDHPEPNDD
jgi:hypothetical protein